ncbi:MAG: VOC family protein [Acidobacteria bacterium]|nr:MAG: VOC family protein [Acidobacteriota bacterium]REJ98401.1 MAG: VOC family protein [Acidobacteriota bacterium]REK17145.1 MAG: VOC family protein [Acidobacteriota bacterium]REK43055.1 MAG: VOC family protein [Acidobacteriota bacterium]
MARIKHVEIAGRDGGLLRDFYSSVFGWEIESRDVGGFEYFEIETENMSTAGIRHEPEGKAEIVVYFEVEDLEEAVERAESSGASVRIPPMEYGDLRFALIEDPEGNPIGLTEA